MVSITDLVYWGSSRTARPANIPLFGTEDMERVRLILIEYLGVTGI